MENAAVGIRFEPCGKIYCFRSEGLELRKGESVVVESELGLGIGRVVTEDYSVEDTEKQIKPVLRKATDEDFRQRDENGALRLEAFGFCIERIRARGLPMKLVGTDVTLDRKRIIFYFVADNRIDFRELVKDLAARFKTRIELRQIGVRDAARMVGGIGLCGRDLCCRRFLTSFEPISIKMAKQQDLSLNASKLSGLCGRLMCCLSYEREKEPPAEREALKEEPSVSAPKTETPAEGPAPLEEAGREAGAFKQPELKQEQPQQQKRRLNRHRRKRWRRHKRK